MLAATARTAPMCRGRATTRERERIAVSPLGVGLGGRSPERPDRISIRVVWTTNGVGPNRHGQGPASPYTGPWQTGPRDRAVPSPARFARPSSLLQYVPEWRLPACAPLAAAL